MKTFTFAIKPSKDAQPLSGDDGLEMPDEIRIVPRDPNSLTPFPLPWDAAPDIEVRGGVKGVLLSGSAGPQGAGTAEVWVPLDDWLKWNPVVITISGSWEMFTQLLGKDWEVET